MIFKRNTSELPPGYRQPRKRRRKAEPQPEPIVVKAKPVIKRWRAPRRLMPFRIRNEYIPRGKDWCQINGQKLRQDVFFGEVIGRKYIPGRLTGGEGCSSALYGFGDDGGCDGGCGDGGCGDGGGGGGGCESEGCSSDSSGTSGDACGGCGEGCSDACESSGCSDSSGCESSSSGCESSGCESSSSSSSGCESSGCESSGCESSGCSSEGSCSTSSDGCGGCSDGCGGCSDSSGCSTDGQGGCSTSTDVSDIVSTATDFVSDAANQASYYGPGESGMGQSPSSGWGQGFGTGNVGYAMGPGNAQAGQLGPFGSFDLSDPDIQDPGIGPGPQQSQTGGLNAPMSLDDLSAIQSHSPGFQAPGDPMGNPNYSISPSAPNVAPEAPSVAPDTQSFLGSMFGVSQANAADRGTDAQAQALQAPTSTSMQGMNQAFEQANQMNQFISQAEPGLANSLSNFVSNYNAPGLAAPGQLGPDISPFDAPSPGAQFGFTGMSPAQTNPTAFNAPQAPVNDPGYFPATANPANFNIDPVAPSQGWPGSQLTAEQLAAGRGNPEDMPHGQIGPGMVMTDPNPTAIGANPMGPNPQSFGPANLGTVVGQPGELTAAQLAAGRGNPEDMPHGQLGPNISPFDPSPTAIQADPMGPNPSAFGPANLGVQQGGPTHFSESFDPFGPQQDTRGPDRGPEEDTRGPQHQAINDPSYFDPDQFNVTVGLAPNQDVISNLVAATRGVGQEPPGGPNPGFYSTQTGGRSSQQSSPFSEPSGRSSSQQGGRSSEQGGRSSSQQGGRASSQSGGRASQGPGYYLTGGPGIAPGARGAEYGGIYGRSGPSGIPGVNFGTGGPGAWGTPNGPFGIGPQSSLFDMYVASLYG